MAADNNFAFKIAAKPLQMVTIDSLQELVVALSNATVADFLPCAVEPQYRPT